MTIRCWVAYDEEGMIHFRGHGPVLPEIPPSGLSILEVGPNTDPATMRVDVSAEPCIEPRPPLIVSRELVSALGPGTNHEVRFTFSVGSLWVRLPGVTHPVHDEDGVIEWATDTPGSYEFRFEHGLFLPCEIVEEVS